MEDIKNYAVDSALDAIALIDPRANVRCVNKAFLKLWGCENENEVVDKPVIELWKDKKEALRELTMLQRKESWIGEMVAQKKDGSTFDAQFSASRVKGKNGRRLGIMAWFSDITIHKKLEKLQELICRIAEEVSTAQNLDDLYKNIHQILRSVMPADNFYIALHDEKNGLLHFPYSRDVKDTDDSSIKSGKTMTDYVIRTGKPQLISHQRFNELIKKGEIEQVGTPPGYWLGVPLITTDNKSIGVMAVQVYEKGREYTEDDENVLVFVSTQVAMAIQRRKEEEEKKEVMLKEIFHRIKNNFYFISNLLDLQGRRLKDRGVKEQFKLARDRIILMAMVHEKLYQSENLSDIDFTGYIKDLVDSLVRAYAVESNKISVNLNVGNISMGIDKAIPCGLIINELFTNSLKHAFACGRKKAGDRENEITVEVFPGDENTVILTVKDNGVGLPKNLDIFKTTSLGLRLVCLLTRQIHGTIQWDVSGGTAFVIKFKL